MTHGRKLNMNPAIERILLKLRSGNGWTFHTASTWALSFPPYAGNFTQEEFDEIVGKLMNARRQKKHNAGSKKEKPANEVAVVHEPAQESFILSAGTNWFPLTAGYPD